MRAHRVMFVLAIAACGPAKEHSTGRPMPPRRSAEIPPTHAPTPLVEEDNDEDDDAPRADASGVFHLKDVFTKRGTTLGCRPERPDSTLHGTVRIEPFGHGTNGARIDDGARSWVVSYRAGAVLRHLDGRVVEAGGRECTMEGQAIVGPHFAVRTLKPLGVEAPARKANGRLPPEVIMSVIRASFGHFRRCTERGSGPPLGHITVRFVINPSGAVTEAKEEESSGLYVGVVSCILHRFEDLAFPKPENGGRVMVVYPIRFEPGG